jgi:fumarylacetoacetate (FAA) hydrolase family protein
MISQNAATMLPDDGFTGTLVGRAWLPAAAGPSVVAIRSGGVYDETSAFATVSALAEATDPVGSLRNAEGTRIGDLDEIIANTPPDKRNNATPWLLAPVDLQVLKAAGVTFAVSMLERVIEERARGNPASAAAIRAEVVKLVGDVTCQS